MKVRILVIDVGPGAPTFNGTHIAETERDMPESPQLGDRLPSAVPGYGTMRVRHREWVESGASVALVVEAECQRRAP